MSKVKESYYYTNKIEYIQKESPFYLIKFDNKKILELLFGESKDVIEDLKEAGETAISRYNISILSRLI